MRFDEFYFGLVDRERSGWIFAFMKFEAHECHRTQADRCGLFAE